MRLADASFSRLNGAVVASLSGEIDASNAGEVGDAVLAALTNAAVGLVLDLRSVQYIDSAGIHLLYRLASDLQARGQALSLVIAQAAPIRVALRLAGVEQQFEIAETVEEGLRAAVGA